MSVGVKQVPDLTKGRLKWDARLISGGTPSTSENSFWTDNESNGTPFVAIADMSGRELVTATNKCLTRAGMQSRNMPIGEPGTLLLAMYASVGEVALLGIRATWNQALLGIIPDPKRLDTRYLRYVLLAMRTDLLRDVRSTTQDNLNAGQIGDLWFPKPGLDEQRAIADYLEQETAQIDALVAKQEEFIGLLRERYESVVRAETSRFEEPYRIDKLGRSTRVGNGSTPKRDVEDYWSKGEVPWLTSTAVNSPEVKNADQFITEQAVIECHLPVVNPGDLLIGLIGQGPTRGKTTICRIRATLSQNLAYISPDRSKWVSEYLLWLLRAKYSEIRQKGAESGAAQGMLNTDDIRRIRVAMPCIAEQKQIVARLEKKTSRIDTLIAKAEEHIALAKERRSALITAAVTGRFDVRTAKKGARV